MAQGSSYAGVPPGALSAFLGVRDANQQADLRQRQGMLSELQVVGGLQKMQQGQKDLQEIEQLKGVMAQSGGDPNKAIAALLQFGTPKSIALAGQLKGLVEKPAGQQIGTGLRLPSGEIIAPPVNPNRRTELESPIAKLMREKNALPPGDPAHAAYAEAIKKASTHQPQVQVNYPPSAGFGINPATGKEGHYTIGKDGNLRWDAVQPIPTPGVRKEAAAAADDALTVDSVRQRVAKMAALIQGNTGVVGPLGIARRVGEAAGGMVVPNIPTPALDYENEKNLMVADVRKLIEKDPNLSNQERETLSRTLGGGTLQSPGSAIRTLNNVLQFIEGKKLRGPSKGSTARPAMPKRGDVVDGYSYMGGDPASQKSWKKVD